MKTLLAVLFFAGNAAAAVPYWMPPMASTHTAYGTGYLAGTLNVYPSTTTAAASPSVQIVGQSAAVDATNYRISGSTIITAISGTGNTAYGVYAGTSCAAGAFYNTFIGNSAGKSNNTGDNNIAIGYSAFATNTDGEYNIALGIYALRFNTTSDGNIAIGHNSLHYNTFGQDNTAVGRYALQNNISGNENSALGIGSLSKNTIGKFNTGIGSYSGNANLTGYANTCVGYYAGNGTTSNSFSSSTIVGYKAGDAITTGSNNLLLGFQSGNALTTGSGNIIIGYDIDAPTAETSNYLNIGGVIVGDIGSSSVTVKSTLSTTNFYAHIASVTALGLTEFSSLPTTGYGRGTLIYLNTDPTKIYLSTETVVSANSWLAK